ncbi:T9SS type A sorting domain-containing protein [Hymenobacter canadensis]|uniref:T9SS type A sorting domain-containing protein n=1 Tax=Hymenobacter canadensis TaxID=2999067 RepID=A0ABY7LIZ0_9BACT|nr:T9SS type A sorting domain-containing protein [Hymenobacter canadensis]WBA40416.1 T9SS type A sorting domain-containing protein [Hymenobacter canadensis]
MKISTRFFGMVGLLLASLTGYAATVVVQVGGADGSNVFSPQNVTIRPGDQVRWEWVSGFHPSVADDGVSFAAFNVSANAPATRGPFTALGTITYHCQPHAFQATPGGPWQGMVGSITVSNAPLATLDSKAAAIGLSLYPNPSKGMVMLTVNQKPGAEYKLRLSNIIGREVRTFTLRPEAATNGMPLNLSDLPAGMYVYSLLLHDKVVATKRLVLQN